MSSATDFILSVLVNNFIRLFYHMMHMYSTVYAVVLCLSICHTCVLYRKALDCIIGTLVYGHQIWNIYIFRMPLLGVLNRRVA